MRTHEAPDYARLHRWSVEQPEAFWPAVADFCGLGFMHPPEGVIEQPGDMTTARWFTGSDLNFAARRTCCRAPTSAPR